MKWLVAGVVMLTAVWGCSDAADDTASGTAAGGSGGSLVGGGGAGGTGAGGAVGGSSAGGAAAGGSATGGSGATGGGGGGVPLMGFGAIQGDCGEIDPQELMAMDPPFEIVNEIDFGSMMFTRDALSPGGQELFDDPNAGGSSKESEIIAYEVLYRCELASLLKTETEIVYDTPGTITDMLVEIDSLKVGVSVVRAFKFMAEYTVADALAKMTEKLMDIHMSTANVSAQDAWQKQILHVIAEKPENVVAVQQALPQIDATVRGDTIIVITLTSGDDAFVY